MNALVYDERYVAAPSIRRDAQRPALRRRIESRPASDGDTC